VKPLLPVLFAGGSFAGSAVLGLAVGILAAGRLGRPILAPAGLGVGALVGAYCAFRLLAKSMA
jgi:hypothetical protein